MKKEIYKPGWSEGMPTMVVDHHHHHRALNLASSYPKPAAVTTAAATAQSLVGPREQASKPLSSCFNVRGRKTPLRHTSAHTLLLLCTDLG